MNAVEIEAAISDLALEPSDAQEFPFATLQPAAHKRVEGAKATARSGAGSEGRA